MDLLNIIAKGPQIASAVSFKIREWIPSGPADFQFFNFLVFLGPFQQLCGYFPMGHFGFVFLN